MNRRNYLQTLSALFAVSAFGGCTSAGKQKDASNSETDIAGPALAGEAFDVPAVSEESKNFYLVSDLGRNGYYEQKTIRSVNNFFYSSCSFILNRKLRIVLSPPANGK